MSKPTLQQAIDQCLAEYDGSPQTVTVYRSALSRFFLEFLKKTKDDTRPKVLPGGRVEALRPNHFIQFGGWLAQRSHAKSTLQVAYAAAMYFLHWLFIAGLIEFSPQEMARLQEARKKIYRKGETRLLQPPKLEAVQAMRSTAQVRKTESPRRERDIALIEFLASTGCRIAEAARLKVEHVDLRGRQARVMGKGRKERLSFLSPEAARALDVYWRARQSALKTDPAFARHDDAVSNGKLKQTSLGVSKPKLQHVTTTGLRNAVQAIAREAGVEFTPHKFRHAFGMAMLKATNNLAIVQDLLGHASPNTTRIYARVNRDDLKQAHQSVYGKPKPE